MLSLPCHVIAPEEFLRSPGTVERGTALRSDLRRYPRLICRGEEYRAALEYRQTMPALPREPGWHGVYVSSISRGGCGFLHSEPLYPGEQLGLILFNGSRHAIEILWCRRLGQRCFAVGSAFLEK